MKVVERTREEMRIIILNRIFYKPSQRGEKDVTNMTYRRACLQKNQRPAN